MIELQKTSIKETQGVNSTIVAEEPSEAFMSVLQSKLSTKDEIKNISIKIVDSKPLSEKIDNPKTALVKLLNALNGKENSEDLSSILKSIGLDKGEEEAILKLLDTKTSKVELSELFLQKNKNIIIDKNSEKLQTVKTDSKIDLKNIIKTDSKIDLKNIAKTDSKIDLKNITKTDSKIDLEPTIKKNKPEIVKTTDIKDNTEIEVIDVKKIKTENIVDIKSTDIKENVSSDEPKIVKIKVDDENKKIETTTKEKEVELPIKNIKAFIKIFEHLEKSIEGKTVDTEIQDKKTTKTPISSKEIIKTEKLDEPKELLQKLQSLTEKISNKIETKVEQAKISVEVDTNIEVEKKILDVQPKNIENITKEVEKLFTFLEKLVKESLPEIKTTKPVSLPVQEIIESVKIEPKVVEQLKEQKVAPKNEKNLQLLLSLPKSKYKEKVIENISNDIVKTSKEETADETIEIAIEKHIETFKNTPVLQVQKEVTKQSNEKITEKEIVSEKIIQLVPQKEQNNFSKEIIINAKNYLEQQLAEIEVKKNEKPTLGALVKLAVAHNIDVEELTIKDITPKENVQKIVDALFTQKTIPINMRQAQSGQIMISRERSSNSSEKISKPSTHTTPLAQLLNLSEQNIETAIVKTVQTPEQIMNKSTNTNILETNALNEELNSMTEQSKSENSELNVKETVKVEARASTQETAKSMIGHFSTSLKEAVKDYRPPFQRLHMKLNPEKLGSVDVTIIQRGQQLHINVSANSTALNMMNSQAAELRTQLNNAGFGDASMEFNQQQDGNKEQQKQEQEQRQQQQNRFTNFANSSDEESPISSLELVMANYF